tara:strand:- start:101 stop:541 length:441 start_codon:yes stop_codon:yes gene_type:complete
MREQEQDYYTNNSEVVELCADDFKNKLILNKKFVGHYGLVKAYAPWCGYCKKFKDDMNFLANNLNNQGFIVGALNCDKYKDVSKSLGVPYYPYLFQVYPNGELKPMELEGGRNIESVLKNICQFTNENNTGNGKCCKKVGNKITCN